jgi:hypothetical protein
MPYWEMAGGRMGRVALASPSYSLAKNKKSRALSMNFAFAIIIESARRVKFGFAASEPL